MEWAGLGVVILLAILLMGTLLAKILLYLEPKIPEDTDATKD